MNGPRHLVISSIHSNEQVAQLSRETALQGALVLAKSGRRYSADITGLSHSDISGLQSYRIRRNNAKLRLLRRSKSFKVTDVGTNRKPVCDFLLLRFWTKNSYFAFFSPLWERWLRGTYTVHRRLIGKLIADFLFVVIELFPQVLQLRRY